MFSSLASALSYKGFHEAAKVISDNIENSLKEKDPIMFATNLLTNILTVTLFKEEDENKKKKPVYFGVGHNNPTLIQIFSERKHDHQLSTCDDLINGDHAITICNDLIFDSNFDKPMKLSLENLNKCCMNVTKPSCEFRAVSKGFVFSEKNWSIECLVVGK